ncbi:hypothetical protein [Billgrantia desiderata]|uniref:hypothetical protein n=1 Tax=Billgrantia desiderata TaxID=52021 RepID=UPI001F35EC82|nr:hypothetical protein [Halomonas desiderata]MCE8011802.1 hypothetical protein [Halomonas desiderata]
MGLKVDKDLILFRLPLGGVDGLEKLVFCHGLETYGVIASNLGALRPHLSRQPLYAYSEIPKAILLFVRESRIKEMRRQEIGQFLLQQADAYVFEWNKRIPESRLHARGTVPEYEEKREGRYIHTDASHAWVHDPIRQRALETEGVYRASAEDMGSGRNIIDDVLSQCEKEVLLLCDQWMVANEAFRYLPEGVNDTSKRFPELIRLGVMQAKSQDEAECCADFFSDKASRNIPVALPKGAVFNKNFVYKAFLLSGKWLAFSEVIQLEKNLISLGHHVERSGMKQLLERECNNPFFTNPYPFKSNLEWEEVRVEKVYPVLPMGYFVSGLEMERPHGKALSFYQVLEYEARRHRRGNECDKSALKNLIGSKELLPDAELRHVFSLGIGGDEDVFGIKSKKGKIDRQKLGDLIYENLRNPVVHAGGYGKSGEAATPPYSIEQFRPHFQQLVRLARELARYFVTESSEAKV